MRTILRAALASAAFMMGGPLAAQGAPDMVSANNPEGVAAALRYAGYPAEMDTDSRGDPMIRTEFAGYKGLVYFYGCGEETHTGCDALQFMAGLDSEQPLNPSVIASVMKKQRFISAFLDDEGDPWIYFDIVTLDGIPAPVFLKSVDSYSWGLTAAAEEVWPD